MGTYVDFQLAKAPRWLRGRFGEAWWKFWGSLKDALEDAARSAVKQRFPRSASPAALELIASDRGLERMPEEDEATHVARLESAFDVWQWGGTRQGVRDALIWTKLFDPVIEDGVYLSPDVVEAWRWPGGDGADATQIVATVDELRALTEHDWLSVAFVTDDEKRWVYDPTETTQDDGATFVRPDDVAEATDPGRWVQRSRWARFWVVIRQPHVFGEPKSCGSPGAIAGTGTICGYTIATVEQGALLSRQARTWKGAHNRGEGIIVIFSGEICGGGWKCGEEADGGDGIHAGGVGCVLPVS
jgi:hypothetical protein